MSASAVATHALEATAARRIASAFLPDFALGNRYDYYYVQGKLRSDPLYPGALVALRGSTAPLLDLGCGLGLLAHALRGEGQAMAYRGVDTDAAKIARATRAARRASLADATFEVVDLARTLPQHHGSVALLDVLQYLDLEAQQRLLAGMSAMLTPEAALVIRSPVADDGGRSRTTRLFDGLAHRIGWMGMRPQHYPTLDGLRAALESHGLHVDCTPLYGRTPFNNWLIVARR